MNPPPRGAYTPFSAGGSSDTTQPYLSPYSRAGSTRPLEESEITEGYNETNHAVDQLLQQHSRQQQHGYDYEGESIESSSEDESEYPSESQPPQSWAQPGSAGTPSAFRRYQPGQYLAPIHTGETLQLSNHQPSLNSTPAPFTSTTLTPYYSAQQSQYYQEDYVPPSNASGSYYEDDTTSFETDEVVDHFQHDTEAYASGNYSRSAYRIPRSRSPTPAVDDEDFHVVGNDSIHYVGRPASHTYDPEKPPLPQDGDSDYLTYGHPSLHENDKKTPASVFSEPETPMETRHFGPAPSGRVLRRRKSKKRVQLTNGNLIVDVNVPPKLVLPRKGDPDMERTRYTAVTCDPDDFEKEGFLLRQNLSGRRTELFIVITMYNEDEILFCRTLYGVMRNISHLCTRKNSQTWGRDAWKKVVVCIVADGRRKVHPRVLDCLTLLGVYQADGFMKSTVDKKPVTAHVFEYTTSFALDPNLHFKYPDKGIVPTQIIFCMKEKNQKKINSHRWFFNAFGPLLQPNVCVLLDVGTRPGYKSIYRLWKEFDLSSNVAGACGEIAVYKGKRWSALLNPLVAAQNFEYKISCILDKPTESMFGYISVLPGAFSAYRYIALQNDRNGVGPLASYFKGEVLHGRDTDIFTSNMYLAEDRILCFELVAKANSSWILKYVKGAIGETDVPETLAEFVSQRRRWLNGSFFAATYAIAHVGQMMRSGHSTARKVMLMIETIYTIINLLFSWFAIGNFYLLFVLLTTSLEGVVVWGGIKTINAIAQYTMTCLIAACFLFTMGNRPQTSKWKYMSTSIILALLMVYLLFASVMCALASARGGGEANSVMLFSVVVTYGLYCLGSILAFDPWHMITSFLPYMLLSPTYINILSIYAFTNLDDISWGTKQDSVVETDLGAVTQNYMKQVDIEIYTDAADVDGLYEEALLNLKNRKPVPSRGGLSEAEQEQNAKDYYVNVRTNVLLAWALSNGLLVVLILGGGQNDVLDDNAGPKAKAYLIFILVFTAFTNAIRFVGSTMYLVTKIFTG